MGLIAFITTMREEFKSVSDNWSKTANARISALQSQSKAAKNAAQRNWYTVNINHLKEVAAMPAPHLEISWTTRFNNFAKYGNVPPAKINLGFEPGPQAAGGKWEGQAVDEAATQEMVAKKTSGGAALWAVNPTPNKYNASIYAPQTAQALKEILKPSFAYGTAPVFTKTSNGWWPTTTEESFII